MSPDEVEKLRVLLIDAPVGRHFAQIHRDSAALVESVGQFIETGLTRGNGVIVLADAKNTDLFLQRLRRGELDPEHFRRSGQLTLLDADSMLERIMRGSMPDWTEFRRTIGSVLESVQTLGRSATRVYGELVSLLWRSGRAPAAIRLEEYWNEMARLYPFCLFCGYMIDGTDSESYAHPIQEIGRTHPDVLATEEDTRFQAALDAASRDVFGIPLSEMLSLAGLEQNPGEHRLPTGQRTMLWIMRNMPGSSADVLERARRYYQKPPPAAS